MNRRIRILAVVLLGCFVLLVVQLANFQVRQASALQHSPYNHHVSTNTFAGDRGEILSADGYVLAKSVPSSNGYPYQRVYPQGSLFADITGYVDVVDANISTGLEAYYGNPFASSTRSQYLLVHQYPSHGLRGLLNQRQGTDSITITVSRKLQLVAKNALGSYRGALVAWDPRNGNILAMYSNPTYNPNKLASHNAKEVTSYYKSLNPASGSSPLVNGVTGIVQFPGSTFKLVTSSAIFDHDPSLASKTWPVVPYIKLPNTTQLLHNYASELCGGTLAQAFAQSCDTSFGAIGLALGPSRLIRQANAYGFNEVPPIDLPASELATSTIPPATKFTSADPFLAYTAIGQYDIVESPLFDAMIAGAVANGGKMMAPHLLSHVVNDQGQVVATYKPHVWKKATSSSTAASVLQLMRGVTHGNGTAAGVFNNISVPVAAKTGTAQVGANGCSDNWLVATAPAGQGETPTVAVAGYVPYQPGLTCSDTGAAVAGPRVDQLLAAALSYQAGS